MVFFSSNGRSAPMIVCNLFVYFQLPSSKINYVEIDVCSKCERYTWVENSRNDERGFFLTRLETIELVVCPLGR